MCSQFSESLQDRMLALTGGGFLYLATVTMLPAVLKEHKSSYWQIISEAIAFALGVSMMVIVAMFE